jgi:hypothetical protein
MLISGRKLHSPDGQTIEGIVKYAIKKNSKNYFHGNCCGKYDHIIEFKDRTAKAARYIANLIRRETLRKLPRSRAFTTGIVLGSEVTLRGQPVDSQDYEAPIRTYSFIRSQGNRLPEFVELARKLNLSLEQERVKMRLVWTDSVFSILIATAYDLRACTSVARSFVQRAQGIESSTIAALRYGQRDSKSTTKEKGPCGLIFAKLKGFKPLMISQKEDFVNVASQYGLQPLRLGDYDRCLVSPKNTLSDILNSTRRLKKDNPRNLLQTSTILLTDEE